MSVINKVSEASCCGCGACKEGIVAEMFIG